MKAAATLLAAGVVLVAAGATRADFILTGTMHLDVNSAHNSGTLRDNSTADVLAPGYIANAYVYNSALLSVVAPSTSPQGRSIQTARVYNSGQMSVEAGRVDYLYAYDTTTVDVSGGLVPYLNARTNSEVTVIGGSITTLLSQHSSYVAVHGGSIGTLDSQTLATADIFGGSISTLAARGFADVTIHGMDFELGGSLNLVGDELVGTGLLKGKWLDGTAWTTNILANDSTAKIHLEVVPEPVTLALLGVGGLALCAGAIRRRRQF